MTQLLLLLSLLGLRRLLAARQLPPPPWRLPALALLLQLITSSGRVPPLLSALLNSYALLVLLSWGLLQLPAALRLTRVMPQILRDLLTLVAAAGVTVVVLQRAGVNLLGLVTTSAVLTAVIGLAAQETLRDLFGGLSMQIGASFKVGDWIDLGDQRGLVESITLMNTVLSTLEGARVVVPNSKAAATALRRLQAQQPVGHRFTVGLDYSHPPAQARELLLALLQHHPQVLEDPPPQVWIRSFGSSSVDYELLLFQEQPGDGPQLRLRGELLEQIWYALEREGRSLPFPVVDLRRSPSMARAGEPEPWQTAAARTQLLAANPLFASLNADQLATLAPLTRCLRFGSGETVVREGEAGDCLYQVVRGAVAVRRGTAVVSELGVDGVFGEMTLFTDAPRNATVFTLAESVLLEVERRDLVPLLEANPGLLEQLSTLVSQRQQQLDQLSDSSAHQEPGSLLERMRQLFASLGVG